MRLVLFIGAILSLLNGCDQPGDLKIEFIEFYCSPTPDPRLDECMSHVKPRWILNCHKYNGRSQTGLACRGYRE